MPPRTSQKEIQSSPRVAFVHDWITGYRGGEKVLEALLELYPTAPIYTLVHQKNSVPSSIESHVIKTSFLQKLPQAQKYYRHFLPLFPFAAETLIREDYDLIISTSHAVAKSVRAGSARHWCYIHSPMRYVWDRFDDYFGNDRVGKIASNLFFKPIAKSLQIYDQKTADRVHHYVANSRFVQTRVQDFYGRNSEVINPPVELDSYLKVTRKPQDYYLFFSALVPYKKADFAIEACRKLGRRLIIAGQGPELKRLKKLAIGTKTEFIERPSEKELLALYAGAIALLYPGVEDFGIVPVEANAAGLPVIGLAVGGLLDSQTRQTCIFYDQPTAIGLQNAIEHFENLKQPLDETSIRQNSLRFSKSRFQKEVRDSIALFLKD